MIKKKQMIKIKCDVCGQVNTSLFWHEGSVHNPGVCEGIFRRLKEE